MQKVKIMTWNVENLFSTDKLYQDKLNVRKDVIKKYDPDIVALQELGDENALMDLSDDTYKYFVSSENPGSRGIRVGFLSKVNLTVLDDFIDFPVKLGIEAYEVDEEGKKTLNDRMSRGALHVEALFGNDIRIEFMTVHFKSKLITFRNKKGESMFSTKDEHERTKQTALALIKRTEEAASIRKKVNFILNKDEDKRVVVLGDFNDVQDAATTQIIEGPDGSRLLTKGFPRPDDYDYTRMFNLFPLVKEERRYSRIVTEKKELIDHIFASIGMFPEERIKMPVVDSLVDYNKQLYSIATDPNLRKDEKYSDHCPVIAEFEFE